MFKIIICLLLITTTQASSSPYWGLTTKPSFTSITRATSDIAYSYNIKTDTCATLTSASKNQIVAEGKVGIKKGATDKLLPMAINTWNFPDSNAMAWHILNQSRGGVRQTRNAVVEGITKCEQLQCDLAVGYGGTPDEQGETTLDSMVMDGATMDVGAVAGLRRIKDAIRVARHVLERTEHTLLVGDSATEFAISMGFRSESLVTPKTKIIYKHWKAKNCQPNFWRNVHPDPKTSCGPYEPTATPLTHRKDDRARTEHQIGAKHHDTIGLIAIDGDHQIHAGTSTNGLNHKIHGRVGDSPIAGAGGYADNEVGAAVATGDGDIMMRFLPTLLAVEAMRNGKSPAEAAEVGIRRIRKHYKTFSGAVIAVNRLGQYAAACHGMREFPFVVSNPTQAIHVETVKCLPPEPSVEVVPLTKQHKQLFL